MTLGTPRGRRRAAKVVLFVACLAPAAWILYVALTGQLAAEPIKDLEHRTGDWALRFILITLAVSPIRRFTGWNGVIRYRRMLGLFAFFYVTVHFLTYLVLDQFFAWHYIVEDVAKRPYITVGFASFLMLIPLAVTSTRGWIRRLGGKRWNRVHTLIYVAAAGGVLHYLWLVKADERLPIAYGLVLVVLLVARLAHRRTHHAAARRVAAPRMPVPEGRPAGGVE